MVIIKSIDYEDLPKNFTGKYLNHIYDIYPSWDFYKNSKCHRYYGPASIDAGKSTLKNKYWLFNGKIFGISENGYNQKQFIKDVNRLWLL